jgi:MFS family permease
LSIAIFTIASALCGMATSLWQIILFRVIQGLAGGGLQPSSQGILIDSFPQEKQGTAMTIFGIAASSLAYFDIFLASAVLAVGLAFLVLLMKRSVAEKGAHIGAE